MNHLQHCNLPIDFFLLLIILNLILILILFFFREVMGLISELPFGIMYTFVYCMNLNKHALLLVTISATYWIWT